MEGTYGLISLLPVLVVIVTAVATKRCVTALMLGTLVGSVILAGKGFFGEWFTFTTTEIGDSAYFIIMFGVFGALIRIMDESGAALGFAELGAKIAKGRKSSQIATWILGMLIFVEDYLNSLGVGVAMQSLTDKYKVSREMLAFIVNSTGASVCILVPVSSWAVIYAANIDETGLFAESGIIAYTKAIPYMIYAMVAIICVPLFIFKILPIYGPMKKAEQRAIDTGRTFPDWYYEGEKTEAVEKPAPSGWWNFVVPMLVLVGVVLYTQFGPAGEADITFAVIVSLIVAGVMLLLQKKMTIGHWLDCIFNGFKDMLYVTILVVVAFILQDVNDALGLTPFVINSVVDVLSPAIFPLVIFIVVAALAFATGSFWGVAAISFPIILPLAAAMDVNLYMAVGVVTAATAFGSHACFYSDAVTVTAAATGIKNIDYARTALPLIIIPVSISLVLYLVLGIVMNLM